jgi:hypothetical protein
MLAVIVVAAFVVVCAAAGIVVYRRTIGSRPYSGSMVGALGLASVLGVLLGLTIGLATLAIVLTMRAAK